MDELSDIFASCSMNKTPCPFEIDSLMDSLPCLKNQQRRKQPSRSCKSDILKPNKELLKKAQAKLLSSPQKIIEDKKPNKWNTLMTTTNDMIQIRSMLKPYIKYANSLLAFYQLASANANFSETEVENAIDLYNHIINEERKDLIVELSNVNESTGINNIQKIKTSSETQTQYSLAKLKDNLYFKKMDNIWPIYQKLKMEMESNIMDMDGGATSSLIKKLHTKYCKQV